MEIQHQHHVTNGRFFVEDEQHQKLALMTYQIVNDQTMLIDHTEVSDKLAGQGVGKKLVEAGVLFARAKDYHVIPQCPYAHAMFQKTPEYADVWAK